MYSKLKPDIVTMDILMKNRDGITALTELLKFDPKAKVVMVSMLGDNKKKESLEKGAHGFIKKRKKIELRFKSQINAAVIPATPD